MGMRRPLLAAAGWLVAARVTAAADLTTTSGTIVQLEQADRVVYLDKERRADLTGHVRLRQEQNVISADVIHVDLDRDLVTAEGHLTWEGPELLATGTRMTFNLKSKTGEVEEVILKAGPWICRGDRVVQSGPSEFHVSPGVLTTCDADSPHYSIHCRTLRIRLNKDLYATDVSIVAGGTPVFWLPVLATPIKDFRLPFAAQVGRTAQTGEYVRTSPAFSLAPAFPSQAHLDFFAKTGWGYGLTQEWIDEKSGRIARVHGYRIRERLPAVETPQNRWELFGESARPIPLLGASRLAGQVAWVSDAHFRELYGNPDLPLPTTAGERRANALLTVPTGAGTFSLQAARTETQHLSAFSRTEPGTYTLSTIHLPQAGFSAKPVPLADWLSGTFRALADRSYAWENGWYVDELSGAPGLDAFTRLPGGSALTVSPGLTGAWRDRGNRVLRLEDGTFAEDANRGGLLSWRSNESLRLPRVAGFEPELTHAVARRVNQIGYDPFGYHGLDVHQAGGRLTRRFESGLTLGVASGYDLRDKQDHPLIRRWRPLTPSVTYDPDPRLSLQGTGDYDLAYHRWRGASGTARAGTPTGPRLELRPSYTDNRSTVPLPETVTTSQEYLLAQNLYGGSFQDAATYSRIFTIDGNLATPLAPHLRLSANGQYNPFAVDPATGVPIPRGAMTFYGFSVIRELHCWELVGEFQKFPGGGYAFHASLTLRAFPREAVPLVSF